LKSIHYGELKKRIVIGHSLIELARELTVEQDLLDELAVLDQYYITTRYPNGLPGALPYEVYTRKQAETAVRTGELVLNLARKTLESL